ncbi:MAG: Sua5/YciO/YrdC/YwlC family protein [Candidatus Gracilibacteria bacterium]|nr:Sua5/YciO/YrdC/YwlC family protein [Candidatus Gracilibacteria bacterium]
MNLFILPTNTCFGIATPIGDIEGYKKIYEIKKRDFDKPLAIMVLDFEWLEKNTLLNHEQIEYLKKYKNPFTVITETKENLIPDNIPNKQIYKKVALRIAHNFMHRSLINDFGPLFLTSANRSGECELFSTYDIKEIFKKEIEAYDIKVFAHPKYSIKSNICASDIFEFIGNTTEINYIRKY